MTSQVGAAAPLPPSPYAHAHIPRELPGLGEPGSTPSNNSNNKKLWHIRPPPSDTPETAKRLQ